MKESFDRFAEWCSEKFGSPSAFIICLIIIVIWAIFGPPLHYSNAWQLSINTSTTILTLLLVILVQATQNKDMRTIMKKLDKLMKDSEDVGDELVGHGSKGEKVD